MKTTLETEGLGNGDDTARDWRRQSGLGPREMETTVET